MIINFDITKTYEEQSEEIKSAIPEDIYYSILKELGCKIKIDVEEVSFNKADRLVNKISKFYSRILKKYLQKKEERLNGVNIIVSKKGVDKPIIL